MAGTFGTKARGFAPSLELDRAALGEVIGQKRALLGSVLPDEEEGTYSLRWEHVWRHPAFAARYSRLSRRERQLLGQRSSVPFGQGYWRVFHQWVAVAVVVGIVIHVVVVLWFAGDAADDGVVYWWHFEDWGG